MTFYSLLEYGGWGLLALRVAIGATFIVHGKGKFKLWKAGSTAPMLGMMRFLAVAETLGGIAVLFGFLTQLAALGLGIIMLGALRYKIFVWKLPFADTTKNGWELDLLILAACVALFLMGAGPFSIDSLWF